MSTGLGMDAAAEAKKQFLIMSAAERLTAFGAQKLALTGSMPLPSRVKKHEAHFHTHFAPQPLQVWVYCSV